MSKFDDILLEINEFGKYQKIRYFLICLAGLLPPIVTYIHSFIAPNVSHKCKANVLYPNVTLGKCHYLFENDTKIACNEWDFSKQYYQSTLTEEWKMVCDRSFFKDKVQMIYFSGYLIGSIVLGYLADVFGRRPVFFSSFILIIFGCIGAAFGPQQSFGFTAGYALYAISRFLIACGTRGINVTGFILALECVGTKQRAFAGIIFEAFFAFGQIMLVSAAFFIRDWRILAIVMIFFCSPFLSYYFIISESPRWLVSKNRQEDAFKVLQKVANTNKTRLNRDTWQQYLDSDDSNEKKENFLNLLKSPILVLITFTSFFNWVVNNFIFYGVGLKSNDLGVNPYLSFGISGVVELFACVAAYFLISKVGRKIPYITSMFIAGVSCLSIYFINGNLIVGVVLAMIGKFFISASYAIIHLYSSELFPTTIRSTCMGENYPNLPFLIFGISGILAAVSSIVLPETLNRRLPECIDDAIQQSQLKCCANGDDLKNEKKNVKNNVRS